MENHWKDDHQTGSELAVQDPADRLHFQIVYVSLDKFNNKQNMK